MKNIEILIEKEEKFLVNLPGSLARELNYVRLATKRTRMSLVKEAIADLYKKYREQENRTCI